MAFDWNDPKVAEQIPINQAIVEALIEFIPASWRSAEVQLEFGVGSASGASQRVVCPDTNEGWTVSQQMIEAVLRLEAHRLKFRLPWRSAVYCVRFDESDGWKASASFADAAA